MEMGGIHLHQAHAPPSLVRCRVRGLGPNCVIKESSSLTSMPPLFLPIFALAGRRRDNGPCYPLFELFIFFTFPSFPSQGTRLSPSSLMFSLSLDCHSHCPPGAGNAG